MIHYILSFGKPPLQKKKTHRKYYGGFGVLRLRGIVTKLV